MSPRTSRSRAHSAPVAVAIALALGADGVAFSLGFSPLAASLFGAATSVVGWWAFVTEP